MSYSPESYERDFLATNASADTRASFLQKVYTHVFASVVLMFGLIALFANTIGPAFAGFAFQSWWLVLLTFMGVSWVAQKMAMSQASRGMQYAGLGLYTLAEALILTPLVTVAISFPQFGADLVYQAMLLTALTFGGLTAVVFYTGANFSFLKGFLGIAFFAVMGLIAVSLIFGLNLGTWFSVAMVALLAVNILYQTSTIRDEFPTDAYVAAALWLVGSIATLFFYILQILMAFAGDD